MSASGITPFGRLLIVAALCLPVTGCEDPFAGCEPSRPTILPDGTAPEAVPQRTFRGHQPESVWGTGRAQVHVVGFRPADGAATIGHPTAGVAVRGAPARVDDQSDVVPAVEWRADGCEYHLWLDPSLTRPEAAAYAGRY